MKEAIKSVLTEFYDEGLPESVIPRDVVYYEKASLATVIKGMRRGARKIHYYPLSDNREVDFHVYDELSGKYSLIQVAWEISNDATFKRELSALQEAKASTGIDDSIVVTWDTEGELGDGIRAVPVWKWCLEC